MEQNNKWSFYFFGEILPGVETNHRPDVLHNAEQCILVFFTTCKHSKYYQLLFYLLIGFSFGSEG
jgi:hypothetical protein